MSVATGRADGEASGKRSFYNIRIIGIVATLLIMTAVACYHLFITSVRDESRRTVLAELETYSETAQIALNMRISEDLSTLKGVAVYLSEREPSDSEGISRMLKQVNQTNAFLRMGYARLDGRVIMHDLDGSEFEKDFSSEPFFVKAKEGVPSIQNTMPDEHCGWVIRYALPVYSGDSIKGVLIATHNAVVFSEIIDLNKWEGYGYANVMDSSGTFILRGNSSLIPSNALTMFDLGTFTDDDRDELARVFAEGGGVYGYKSLQGESMLAIAKPLTGNDWYLLCSLMEEYITAPYMQSARLVQLVMLISLILFVITVWLGIRAIVRNQRQLMRQYHENAAVVRQSGRNLIRYDIKGGIAYFLGGSNAPLGLPETMSDYPEALLKTGLIAPESRNELRAYYGAMKEGIPSGGANLRFKLPDRGMRWMHSDYVLLPSESGAMASAIVSFYDNTEQREKELVYELMRAERQTLIDGCDFYTEADLASGEIMQLHGDSVYSAPDSPAPKRNLNEMVEWDLATFVYHLDVPAVREFYNTSRLITLYAQGVYTDSMEFRSTLTGALKRYRSTVQMIKNPESKDIRLYIFVNDSDGENAEAMRVREKRGLDSLTGLPNHETTFDEISAYLLGEGATGTHALFLIDIDDFKQVNHTVGHQLGDKVLVDLSDSLRGCFRSTDILGRIGGDEFLALLKDTSSASVIKQKTEELLSELQYVCAAGSHSISLSGSIGVTVYHGDEKPTKTINQLYAEADAALYKAKAMGKHRCAFADEAEVAAVSPSVADEQAAFAVNLRGLLNNLGSGVEIYHGTPSGQLTPMFCNKSLLDMLDGMSERDFFSIYGSDAFYGVHPDDRAELEAALNEAKSERRSFKHTYRMRGANDVYYYVTVFCNFVCFDDGSYDMYAIFSDAEQAMRARAELSDRYRFFREDESRLAASALNVYRLDLTADAYADVSDGAKPLDSEASKQGVDTLFDWFRNRIDAQKDPKAFCGMFTREELINAFRRGETMLRFDFPCLIDENRMKWLRMSAHLAKNPDTGNTEALISLTDVDRETRLFNMMRKLIGADYEFLAQIDVTTRRIMIFGGNTLIETQYLQSGVADYAECLEQSLSEMMPPSYYEDCLSALRLDNIVAKLENADDYICTFPIAEHGGVPAGYRRWRCCYMDSLRNVIVISRTDVTDTVSSERDALTGLLNQQGFYHRVRSVLDANPGKRFRIHRFDIDNFKLLNETLGYEKGDKLLRDMGASLRRRGRRADDSVCFARIEADHFASLRPDDGPDAESLTNDLRAWTEAYPADFAITSHMGVYLIDDPSMDVSAMCDRAHLALDSIKGDFSRHVAYYNDSMRDTLIREQKLSGDMEAALREGQFMVYFQPQYNYEDGSLIGAEALVRWKHPQLGLISPGEFIPLFERNGFIERLDQYVWDRSCYYLRKWISGGDGRAPVPVSVNISRKDMYNPKLISILQTIMRRHGITVSMLKLEITETAYMHNPNQIISVVRSLRQAGFTVEMDDFGTGYSSLNTLKEVQVDMLKLDMKFLEQDGNDERGGNILASVIRMAHWLKLPIIAEGVETKAQADYLKSLGCVYMQGYYFSRPIPADEYEKLMLLYRPGRIDTYAGVDLTGVAAFWNPATQIELIFNSFVGGAAIVEYRAGNAEILRANDKFYTQIETTRAEYQDKQLNTLARFEGVHRAEYKRMLDEASLTGGEAECEICSLPHKNGRYFWTHNRAKLLAKNGDSSLLYMATENITEKKEMEQRLGRRTEALQLAVSQMDRYVCTYDIVNRVLTLPKELADKHGSPPVLRDDEHLRTNAVINEDKEKYTNFYRRIKNGEPRVYEQLRSVDAEGRRRYIWQQLESSTVFDGDGAPLRAIITCEDITLRKEQEAEAARNNIIMEYTGICVLDYDVATDTMVFRSRAADGGRAEIHDYIAYFIDTDSSRVHPVYKSANKNLYRRMISEPPQSGVYEYVADNWGNGYRWSRLHYVTLGDDSGKVYRVIGQISDIQKEKDDEALIGALNDSLHIETPEYRYNATIAERVFTTLYSGEASEATIWRLLKLLGEHYDLSRAYIFEDSPDGLFCSDTFEWCAKGVLPQKDSMQSLSYETDMGGIYRDLFDQNGILYCEDTWTLAYPIRELFTTQDTKSTLQSAIMDDGRYAGFIGFDECRRNRIWTNEQIGTLMLVSRIIGSFLMVLRKRERSERGRDETDEAMKEQD